MKLSDVDNAFFAAAQETEAVKKLYTKIVDAYGCLGVLQLNAGESTVLYLVMITGCFSIGKIGDTEIFRITQTQFVPLHYQQNEDRISEVRFFDRTVILIEFGLLYGPITYKNCKVSRFRD